MEGFRGGGGERRRHHHYQHEPSVLESEWRKAIQPVEPVVELISREIRPRRVAVDFGAGTGYYTIPLSRLFDTVYAVDSDPRLIKILGEKLRAEKVDNVVLVEGDRLPEVDADLIFLANVLHELPDPEAFLRDAADRARFIIVIDWKKEETPRGPPLWERIPEDEAVKMLSRFYRVRKVDIYRYHYVLIGARG